jgi:hypothetical protein
MSTIRANNFLDGAGGNTATINGDVALNRSTNINLEVAVASTSGTAIDFTGIPSWVKRITILFVAVSTNGSSGVQVQLGDSGGIETSGYLGSTTVLGAGAVTVNLSSGFLLNYDAVAGAANSRYGSITISKVGGNVWAAQGIVSLTDATRLVVISGAKELSSTLDRLRVTTVSGSDTFDAGTLTISWE